MVLVRKFFCFDLFTTGLLFGWLGLAEAITSCITSILMLENIDSTITPEQFPNEDVKHIRTVVINIFGTNIALNIIDLLASGLLIAGTVKRNRLLLLPWLINSTISLLFAVVVIIYGLVFLTSSPSANYATMVPLAIGSIIVFAIYVYAWISIYSLYDHIRRSHPNNEYSSLIDSQNCGHPIYSRA